MTRIDWRSENSNNEAIMACGSILWISNSDLIAKAPLTTTSSPSCSPSRTMSLAVQLVSQENPARFKPIVRLPHEQQFARAVLLHGRERHRQRLRLRRREDTDHGEHLWLSRSDRIEDGDTDTHRPGRWVEDIADVGHGTGEQPMRIGRNHHMNPVLRTNKAHVLFRHVGHHPDI
jgi:hypothetical protein